MKKFTFCFATTFLLICSGLFAQKSTPYFSRVIDYRPAPGQFTNENYPKYESGDGQASINAKVEAILRNPEDIISLGAYGGYVILAFDEPIVNAKNSPFDFKVYGNAFVNNSEPGIVMVSYDANGNGITDDEWFELAGSEYANCQKGYEITYQKPNPLNSNIIWTDNMGGSGEIKRNNFHTQESYYPLWLEDDSLTFSGTLFPDSLLKKEGQWGYTDNVHNDSTGCNFKISWAVDSEGQSVTLPAVHFVKIYTAINKSMGVLGEISTEVQYPGVEDLHPSLTYGEILPVEKNTLDTNKEYHILNLSGLLTSPDTIWDETFHYDPDLDEDGFGTCERTFMKDSFLFHQTTSDYGEYGIYWSGITYSNKTDVATKDYSNEFSSITGRGVDSIGSTYLVAFNENVIEFAGEKAYRIAGTYVTNTTVGYHIINEGNAFAKKFGGAEGTDSDWFKVTFTGINEKGDTTGNVDFYLADFRFDNSEEDYIVKNWRWVDLSSLGKVAKIYYTFSSSDVGAYGMNTPTYFCMDKIAVEKHSANAQLVWIKTDGTDIPNFDMQNFNYTIELPEGTTNIPIITAGLQDSNAKFEISSATNLSDTVKIEVISEDGNTIQVYRVNFAIQTSVKELETKQIKIYPNPVQDYLHIENIENSCIITVYDINGRMISSQKANSQATLNAASWQKGTYILHVENGKTIKPFKIIKE